MSIVFIAFSLRPKKGTQIMELTREKSLFITIFVPKNVLTIKALKVIKAIAQLHKLLHSLAVIHFGLAGWSYSNQVS